MPEEALEDDAGKAGVQDEPESGGGREREREETNGSPVMRVT